MEELRLSVCVDVGFGQLKVVVEVFLLSNIPDASRRIVVMLVGLREHIRVHLVKEFDRRSRVPVGDRSAVFGMPKVALKGVFENSLSQFATVFKRPEKGTLVVTRSCSGELFVSFGIGNDIGESLLEDVIHTDTEHNEIEALLQYPIELDRPILKAPMLCLKTVQTAVRKVPNASVIKARRLGKVDAGQRKLTLRDTVSVPEVTASAEKFKVTIYGVYRSAGTTARKEKEGLSVELCRSDAVIISSVANAKAIDLLFEIKSCRYVVYGIISDQYSECFIHLSREVLFVGYDLSEISRNRTEERRERICRDLICTV